jgi:hypothetical protein
VTRLRRRLLLLAIAGSIAASLHAASASAAAGSSFFVGADEDALLWGSSQQTSTVARTLGLRSIRITMQWKPGQTAVSGAYQAALTRLLLDSYGIRVAVSVYGNAADAPQTDDQRNQYCSFVADLVKRFPEIDDVAIWNDPNDGTFWMPQFNQGGTSVSPQAYEALLATCYDQAHAANKSVNVIAVAVSKSSNAPGAFTLAWHPPATWFKKLGAAYKASHRTQPIFDTLGYIPHAASSSERPWTKHPGASGISLGDYSTLMSVLGTAFRGTGQPVPGQGATRIWYLAQGFQTTPDQGRTGFTGTETDPAPVASWSPNEAADTGDGPGVDQAMQLEDAIRVAYCQPAVGAYFNFHLYDERDLAGWQSGVFWPDGSPKASYQALRTVTGQVNSRSIDCASFVNGVPPRAAALQKPAGVALQIQNVRTVSLAAFGATVGWTTTVPANVQVSYGLLDFGVPTVWSSAGSTNDGQVASLIGLDSSTRYRVWLKATSDDGQTAQATLDLTTPSIPANPTTAIGTPVGAVMLDGMPFFPMILYSVCPWEYGGALASGINVFSLNACGTFQQQVNALGGQAYSLGVAGGNSASGPGIIGWFHKDEPDGDNTPASALPPRPPGVPSLSFLTLTNHFYTGAAPLPWDPNRNMYPSLIAKADVIGFDLYPLQEWCRPSTMVDVYRAQKQLVALSGQKPTFQWIEAATWKCGGANTVTAATIKAESWLAIAGGAHGLGYWPGSWDPGFDKTIAGVRRDVDRLGPAVYMPNVAVNDDSAAVQVSARVWNGAVYVIAVNSSFDAADATINVPPLNGRPLTVIGESRKVNADGDVYHDHFAPLAVHLYVAAPA